jgi:hypothetical protein
MVSPAEPERCRVDFRNAPEWWDRCEEQGIRMRECPRPGCKPMTMNTSLQHDPERRCTGARTANAIYLAAFLTHCILCAEKYWEPLGLNDTFGLTPFEVHAPGESQWVVAPGPP